MNVFACCNQSIYEQYLLPHSMCQLLLPRSSTNPGSGSGSVSPSMQPAEENQGPGTTQIRHQGFQSVKLDHHLKSLDPQTRGYTDKWSERS